MFMARMTLCTVSLRQIPTFFHVSGSFNYIDPFENQKFGLRLIEMKVDFLKHFKIAFNLQY